MMIEIKSILYRVAVMHVAIVISGCVSPDERFQSAAEKAVTNQLKDPDSARFDAVYVVRKPRGNGFDLVAACGLVNARNSFGGYTGGQRFVVHGSQSESTQDITYVRLEGPERGTTTPCVENRATTFEYVYWNEYCVDELHPPTYSGERGELCGLKAEP